MTLPGSPDLPLLSRRRRRLKCRPYRRKKLIKTGGSEEYL
jgi:hypothetical protein